MLRTLKSRVEHLYNRIKNIKHLVTYIFLIGFLIDFVTLPSPDTSASWIIGIVYVLAVGGAILAREYFSIRSDNPKRETYIGYSYIATSFFMGSLLSYVFIYYFRSADYIVGLPIIIGLLVFVILNELINTRNIRLLFDTSLYFLGSFFFFIFLIPIFVGTVNNNSFIVSVIVTVLYFISYFYTLSYVCKIKLRRYIKEIYISLAMLTFIIILFVFKVLPAVPLSLKDSGVYEKVTKSGSSYIAISEKKSILAKVLSPRTFHYDLSGDIYFYSSVHAPTSISTSISHTWEYYDDKAAKWIIYNKIPYTISGGRDGGYRAYTYKSNLKPGKWRVVVRSADDRVIGRYTFNLQEAGKSIMTQEVKL